MHDAELCLVPNMLTVETSGNLTFRLVCSHAIQPLSRTFSRDRMSSQALTMASVCIQGDDRLDLALLADPVLHL